MKRLIQSVLFVIVSIFSVSLSQGELYRWDWVYPAQKTNPLEGVWAADATHIYAVGNDGAIFFFDGTNWSPMSSPTRQWLNAVWGTDNSHIFAVGHGGTVLRYNGSSWMAINIGISDGLADVYGFSVNNVFAVGWNGTIVHYDGSNWNPMTSGTSNALMGVWGSSTNNVYAVGENGTVLKYDGSSWSSINLPTNADFPTLQNMYLTAAWGTSANDVYLAGNQGLIVHFDGTQWTIQPRTWWNNNYSCITGTSSSDIVAGGESGGPCVVHYDGIQWETMNANYSTDFKDIVSLSPSLYYAVGSNGFFRYDGVSWLQIDELNWNRWLDVHGSNASDIYAVGEGGKVLHFNGSQWAPVSIGSTTSTLFCVWAFSNNDVFIGGDQCVYNYNGSSWSLLRSDISANDIFPLGLNEIYFLNGGEIKKYDRTAWTDVLDSNTWNTLAQQQACYGQNPGPNIRRIWGTSGSNLYAAGDGSGGTLIHYNGSAWSLQNTGISNFAWMFSLFGFSSSDIYAAGAVMNDEIGLIHFDGSQWSRTSERNVGWHDLWGNAATNLFSVDNNRISYYDGNRWKNYNPGTGANLNAVWGVNASTVYAVGSGGAIIRGVTAANINTPENFPDANFRIAVENFMGVEHEEPFSAADAATMTGTLNCSSRNIADLTGIHFFTGISDLQCQDNQLINLDVSLDTSLRSLDCRGNQITQLNFSSNLVLKRLLCGSNQITSITFPAGSALEEIECNNNILASLAMTNCANLKRFICHSNQLTSLNVSQNTALQELRCSDNQINALDVTNNIFMRELFCESNQLTSLDVSHNVALTMLELYSNQLTAIDVSSNLSLISFGCAANNLTTLDVSNHSDLVMFNCCDNQITTLNLTGCSSMFSAYCYSNQLNAITLTGCAVDTLNLNNNFLTNLDLSTNANLANLYCNNNQLTSLDLSNNPALRGLWCSGNFLNSLDVSHNPNLMYLNVRENGLTALDVSSNPLLYSVDCAGNQIASINSQVSDISDTLIYSNDFTNPINIDPTIAWPEWIDACYPSGPIAAQNGRIEWVGYESGATNYYIRLNQKLPAVYTAEFDFFYQSGTVGRFSLWPLCGDNPWGDDWSHPQYFLRNNTHYFDGADNTPTEGTCDLSLALGANPHRIRLEVSGDRIVLLYKNRGQGNFIKIDERDFPQYGEGARYLQLGFNLDEGQGGLIYIDNLEIRNGINFQVLRCDHNQLTQLDLSCNTNLRQVLFENNQIDTIASVVGLTNLEAVDVRWNYLDVGDWPDVQSILTRIGTANFDQNDRVQSGIAYSPQNSPDYILPGRLFNNPSNGHQYILLPNERWSDAEAKAVSLGGHLVTINDLDENQWIVNTILQNLPNYEVFTGFNDLNTEGTWMWISGEPVTFTNWGQGEPNNSGDEDFGSIWAYRQQFIGSWNDNRSEYNPALLEVSNVDSLVLISRIFSSPSYQCGSQLHVTIEINNTTMDAVQFSNNFLNEPILEILPPGWTPSNVSDGGLVNENNIRWEISVPAGVTRLLTYDVAPPLDAYSGAGFSGTAGNSPMNGPNLDAQRYISKSHFQAGESIQVTLQIKNTVCSNTPFDVYDGFPNGWTVSNISDGGYIDANRVRWNGIGIAIGDTETLTYTATAPAIPTEDANWWMSDIRREPYYSCGIGGQNNIPYRAYPPVIAGQIYNNPNNNHTYVLLSNHLDWSHQQQTALDLGGYLTTINDSQENQWIIDTMGSNVQCHQAWIGYTDQDHEGLWTWVNGETPSYINWAQGEPTSEEGQNHSAIYTNPNDWQAGKWNAEWSNNGYPAFAEINQGQFVPGVFARRYFSQNQFVCGDVFQVFIELNNITSNAVEFSNAFGHEQIHEYLSQGWSAFAISDGGQQNGNEISWNVSVPANSTYTMSYSLQNPPDILGGAGFSGTAGNSGINGPGLETQRFISQDYFIAGDSLQVSIQIKNTVCNNTPFDVYDGFPNGWTITNISDGGFIDSNRVRWNGIGIAVGDTDTLTYTATAPAIPTEDANWWMGEIRREPYFNWGFGGQNYVPYREYQPVVAGQIYTNPANNHTYVLLNNHSDWNRQQQTAIDLGGYLTTINDVQENQWIVDTIGSGMQNNQAWIGYTDRVQEGSWQWINGETSTYENWAQGEPNNNGDQDYGVIYPNPWDGQPGKWDDYYGNSNLPAIAEINPGQYVPGVFARRYFSQNQFACGDVFQVFIELTNMTSHVMEFSNVFGHEQIREYISQGWTAFAISDGGQLNGTEIAWSVSVPANGTYTLNYSLQNPPDIIGGTGFGGTAGNSGIAGPGLDAQRYISKDYFVAGGSLQVSIQIKNTVCSNTPFDVYDGFPNGWTIANISDGGYVDTDRVRWNGIGCAIGDTKTLTYTAIAPAVPTGDANWWMGEIRREPYYNWGFGGENYASYFFTADQDAFPVDLAETEVTVLLEDYWLFKGDIDNALYWEPYTDIFGDGTIAIAAGVYPEGISSNAMNCKVGFIKKDGSIEESWAWRADDGTAWTGNFNFARTNASPPRIACDRRPGGTRYLVGQESTLWSLNEFNTNGRFSGSFQYDWLIAAVQLFNKTSNVSTPITNAFDPIYGAGGIAGAQNGEQIRFGGEIRFLSNGNFVTVPEDRTNNLIQGFSPIITVFNGETGQVINGPFVGCGDGSARPIWSNVAAFNGGFCTRASGYFSVYNNDGNLRYHFDQSFLEGQLGITPIITDRGDASRIASANKSNYVYLVGRNQNNDIALVRFDAVNSSQSNIVGGKETIVAFSWNPNYQVFDRAEVAVDDNDNVCVIWEESFSSENEQIVARIYNSNFDPVTPVFYAFKNHDAWNDALYQGFESNEANVSMDTQRIVIAADGVIKNPTTGGLTPKEQTFVTVLMNPMSNLMYLTPISNVNRGEDVEIAVNISDASGIVGYRVALNLDPNKVSYVNGSATKVGTSTETGWGPIVVNSASPELVIFTCASASGTISSGSASLMKFILHVSYSLPDFTPINVTFNPLTSLNEDAIAYGAKIWSTTVLGPNNRPMFMGGPSQYVMEDSGMHEIFGWATNIIAGPAYEYWQSLNFTLDVDKPQLFFGQPTLDAAGTLRYTLASDEFGVCNATAMLYDSGGTANGGINYSTPYQFIFTVNPVNDAPSFIGGASAVVLNATGGQHTFPGWATAISAGPANESTQTLWFNVVTNRPDLFSATPSIDAGGTLRFTPAVGAHGVVKATATLYDNGGTGNGGINKSSPALFVMKIYIPFLWGDLNANGQAGAVDASLLLRYAADLIDAFPGYPVAEYPEYYPNPTQPWNYFPLAADVNADGIAGTWDASLVLQKYVWLIQWFPADTSHDQWGPDAPLPPGKVVKRSAPRTMNAILEPLENAWKVTLQIDDAEDVQGLRAVLLYDPAQVQFNEKESGWLVESGLMAVNAAEPGRLVMAGALGRPLSEGQRDLLTVKFDVVGNSYDPLRIEIDEERTTVNDGHIRIQLNYPESN